MEKECDKGEKSLHARNHRVKEGRDLVIPKSDMKKGNESPGKARTN